MGSAIEPYLLPDFGKEDKPEMVFTWIKEYEDKNLCVYDTEFGYYLNHKDIDAYVNSFDFETKDEVIDFADKLNYKYQKQLKSLV